MLGLIFYAIGSMEIILVAFTSAVILVVFNVVVVTVIVFDVYFHLDEQVGVKKHFFFTHPFLVPFSVPVLLGSALLVLVLLVCIAASAVVILVVIIAVVGVHAVVGAAQKLLLCG